VEVVLYIGGSKHGDRGVLPHGFSKTRVDSRKGSEIYVQRFLAMGERKRVPVMILENLHEDTACALLYQQLN